MHGVCNAGDSCRFSHDRTNKPSMICKFYLSGNCSYGTHCRYARSRQYTVCTFIYYI